MLQQDTIKTNTAAGHAAKADNIRPSHRLTPADVLSMLPADATPEQQDSAIQAVFQPAEIHYSDQPDTLRLPGQKADEETAMTGGLGFADDMFARTDTLAYARMAGNVNGVAGDPVPYTVRGDDLITGLLLAGMVLVAVSLSNSRRFIARQLKNFIYVPRNGESSITETSSEVRFQLFLVLHTCLQFSIFQYFYTQHYVGETFILESQYHLIAIYFAMFAGYFITKALLYMAVNTVFFGIRKNMQWMKSQLFITSSEGVLLLPVVLLQVYFDLPIQNVVVYFIVVLILVKILTFYKCHFIFFRHTGRFLQIILYFCALEIIPIAAFWGALVITGNRLNINF
ncbi:MAG: DUF4271 domain-containing protein [Prevotella sp.]|nr:DUF4271 domain-containing protein [Prevotella sp.]